MALYLRAGPTPLEPPATERARSRRKLTAARFESGVRSERSASACTRRMRTITAVQRGSVRIVDEQLELHADALGLVRRLGQSCAQSTGLRIQQRHVHLAGFHAKLMYAALGELALHMELMVFYL